MRKGGREGGREGEREEGREGGREEGREEGGGREVRGRELKGSDDNVRLNSSLMKTTSA